MLDDARNTGHDCLGYASVNSDERASEAGLGHLLTHPMVDTHLTIELRHERPVELADISTSFGAIAHEYEEWSVANDSVAVAKGVKLYVSTLRTGSIIAELAAMAPLALPFVENTLTVIEFAKHLRFGFDVLLGRNQDVKLPRHTYENLCSFVEPVAKDGGSQVNVSTTINGDVHVHLHLDSVAANASQNTARRRLAEVAPKQLLSGRHDNVVLYLYQARFDAKSTSGDRGVIESQYSGPVRLVFASESLKAQVLDASDNPFKHAYLVDVQVETVEGKPMLYQVLGIHEIIDRPEAA